MPIDCSRCNYLLRNSLGTNVNSDEPVCVDYVGLVRRLLNEDVARGVRRE